MVSAKKKEAAISSEPVYKNTPATVVKKLKSQLIDRAWRFSAKSLFLKVPVPSLEQFVS
jgi:hypothetical protein